MKYKVIYFDYPDGSNKKKLLTQGFERFEDALNMANCMYDSAIDEDVYINDEEYGVTFSVREDAWY